MSGNDVTIMLACFGFGFGLFPMVWSDKKAPRLTCLISGVSQTTMTAVMINMEFWWAAVGNTICSLAWWIVFFQRRKL